MCVCVCVCVCVCGYQGAEAVSHKAEGYMADIRALSPEGAGVDLILEMAGVG